MKIPAQYLPVMPYLLLSDAGGFLSFTQKVFDAQEQMLVPANDNKIRHGEIRIHDAVIMFADEVGEWKAKSAAMFIYVPNVNSVYAKAMEEGARSLGAPEQKEYGYTAGFEDPFGNQWFIAEPEKE